MPHNIRYDIRKEKAASRQAEKHKKENEAKKRSNALTITQTASAFASITACPLNK